MGKLVNEKLEFTRGIEPKKSLQLGINTKEGAKRAMEEAMQILVQFNEIAGDIEVDHEQLWDNSDEGFASMATNITVKKAEFVLGYQYEDDPEEYIVKGWWSQIVDNSYRKNWEDFSGETSFKPILDALLRYSGFIVSPEEFLVNKEENLKEDMAIIKNLQEVYSII